MFGSYSFGSGCSTTNSDIWRCGSTVYYGIYGFAANSTEKSQIESAISLWNSSNTSGITFSPASTVHPAKFSFIAGTTNGSANGTFAFTSWQTVTTANRRIVSATTTFYLNETFSTGGNAITHLKLVAIAAFFLK
jgi:hypothetical protein